MEVGYMHRTRVVAPLMAQGGTDGVPSVSGCEQVSILRQCYVDVGKVDHDNYWQEVIHCY